MARVHYVKKARKDNPAVNAGEPYWWWSFRYAGRRFSATEPRSSQLTQSEYRSTFRKAQEALGDEVLRADNLDDVKTALADAMEAITELSKDCHEKLGLMPDDHEYADVALQLEQRIEACDETAESIGGVIDLVGDEENWLAAAIDAVDDIDWKEGP